MRAGEHLCALPHDVSACVLTGLTTVAERAVASPHFAVAPPSRAFCLYQKSHCPSLLTWPLSSRYARVFSKIACGCDSLLALRRPLVTSATNHIAPQTMSLLSACLYVVCSAPSVRHAGATTARAAIRCAGNAGLLPAQHCTPA